MSCSSCRFRFSAALGVALALSTACARRPAPAAISPQDSIAGDPNPLVTAVHFDGAAAIRAEELREAIVTQHTQCRSTFLLKPICVLTRWSALMDYEYLDREEVPRDELRLEVLYFRRGYRYASVTSEVVPTARGVDVRFTIQEGQPTLVESLQVTQTEQLLSARQVRRALLPVPGEPLDLARLEAGMFQLESLLGGRGYLDAQALDSIELPTELSARVQVTVTPGKRSTLAEIDIEGNEGVEDRTIEDAVRLRHGRVLRTSDLVGSQRSLYESNLFHEARVELPAQPDSAKRLEITVREAPPRAARVGGGFNTTDFVQVEGRYTHYNFMGRGRRLDVSATVGNLFASTLNNQGIFHDMLPPGEPAFAKPTWQAGLELMQPGFLSADNRVGVGLFVHRRTIPNVVIDEGHGASLSATRRLDFETPLSAEYRFENTAVEAGDLYFCANYGICDLPSIEALRGRHMLSPIGLALFSDHADDPLSPRRGYRARVELEHASAATLSDFRYNRIAAEASGYYPVDLLRQRILSGRIRVGWVAALAGTDEALGLAQDGSALLHPRRRFFSGGSRSVRGFAENQLGPRVLTVDPAFLLAGDAGCSEAQILDGSCDPSGVPLESFIPRPLGGRSVLEGSVEYRFPLFGSFQGAAFVDAGVVRGGEEGQPPRNVAAITPGFGFRYHSPIAPIRVDLGYRPALVEALPVLTEVIDQNGLRQLVRLDTPLVYDPVGAAGGGWWSKLMAQLRLHVSIGEAF
jgi:outer membrane protein insertion porin family/translocation and assembly module TamA